MSVIECWVPYCAYLGEVTESYFLGRLKRSLGVPKERGSGILKEEERTNFFVPLHSLKLYKNNVSCLRTVSGKKSAG